VLPEVEDNLWQLNLVNNVNASLIFVPLIILNGEVAVLLASAEMLSMWFWSQMIVAGVFGFAIGYVTGLQIQVSTIYIYIKL
jgi:GDP-fucose transporter C1